MNTIQNPRITHIENQIREFNNTPHKLLKYHNSFMNELRIQINRCEEILDVLKTQLKSETESKVKNHLKKSIHSFNNSLKPLVRLHYNIIKSY